MSPAADSKIFNSTGSVSVIFVLAHVRVLTGWQEEVKTEMKMTKNKISVTMGKCQTLYTGSTS